MNGVEAVWGVCLADADVTSRSVCSCLREEPRAQPQCCSTGLQKPADCSLAPGHKGDGAHMRDGLLPGRPPVPSCSKHPCMPPCQLLEAMQSAPEEQGVSGLERIPSLSQGVHVGLETAHFLSGLSMHLFNQIVCPVNN